MSAHQLSHGPPEVATELNEWRRRALNLILAVGAAGGLVLTGLEVVVTLRLRANWIVAIGSIILTAIALVLASFRPLKYEVRAWAMLAVGCLVAALVLVDRGLVSNGPILLVVLPLVATLLIGWQAGILMACVGALAAVVFTALSRTMGLAAVALPPGSMMPLEYILRAALGFGLVATVLVLLAHSFSDTLVTIAEQRNAMYIQSEELRAFHSTIVETMSEGILVVDADERIAYVNPAGADMLDYSMDELVGKHWSHIFAPEAVESVAEEAAKRARGFSSQYDTALLAREGGQVAALVSGRPSFEGDRVTGAIAVFTDITERRQAQAALGESESRLRNVLHNMPVMLVACDEQDVYVEWNRECEQVTGYSAAEIVGNPRAMELLYPDADYRERTLAEWAAQGQDFRGREREIACKDGTTRTVAFSSISRQEPVPGWANWGVAVDVSERKRAEEKLHRSEARARAILNASIESIILIDTQGTIVDLNETAARRLGRETQDLIGVGFEDLVASGVFSAELGERRWTAIVEVLRSGQPIRFEDERSGIILDNTYYPIFDEDGSAYQLAIYSRDITDQRYAEQQARWADRMATIGQLTAVIAHEINNPLQAIQTNLDLLGDFSLPPEERERRLEGSYREIERLSAVAKRVLEYGMPGDEERTVVPSGQVMMDAWSLMGARLRKAGIQAATNISPDALPVYAARTQLVQVLVNLINNAIEAMPEGGHLDLSTNADGDWVRLDVANDGPHLTPDELDHAFDPYYTTKPGHAGIGLWITRRIVEAHEGIISAANLPGNLGVVFTMKLLVAGTGAGQEAVA